MVWQDLQLPTMAYASFIHADPRFKLLSKTTACLHVPNKGAAFHRLHSLSSRVSFAHVFSKSKDSHAKALFGEVPQMAETEACPVYESERVTW